MEYLKGDRVKHPSKDDWGLGEVLEDSNTKLVRVFFVEAGEKTLDLAFVQPRKVSGSAASHPALDNLTVGSSKKGDPYQNLSKSIRSFLEQFPEGFNGKKFKDSERDYKVKAHALATELLGQQAFGALQETQYYSEITRRALKVVNATNLIFPYEKMLLRDGLTDRVLQTCFGGALFELLYGEQDLERRFIEFSRTLEKIGAAQWTTATYFLFIVHPDKYMFVKPNMTQHASASCRFEINYKPQLNWLTYNKVLTFSCHLFRELSDLKPRDMIDVQSFMWCIAPRKCRSA
jgi:hypothetical protein